MKKVKREFNIRALSSLEEFVQTTEGLDLHFPVSENTAVLSQPITLRSGRVIPNSIGIPPLEGFDGTREGAPTELVFRRYERYARGGAGLIWYEATAVSNDGRCNPVQMMINRDTMPELKRLLEHTNRAAMEEYGRKPYSVLQLTHSGRRSVDQNFKSRPLAAAPNPYMDAHNAVDGSKGELTIASDEKIEEIIHAYIDAAALACEAGFDAADVKPCHEYIIRELLSAYTRPGKYGGSFENRTRAVLEIARGIRERLGDKLDVCVRLNAYDCIPYPYGWGMVKEEGVMKPNLTEPIELCRLLVKEGVQIINITTMMPRYVPYGRGMMIEHDEDGDITPFHGVECLLNATHQIKQAVPEGVFMCTGLTWLDVFGANVAAGGKEQGWFDIAGFGRQGFAYPNFARDLMEKGALDKNKVCLTCDMCYDFIQNYKNSGCAARDPFYQQRYREEILPLKRNGKK